MKTIYLNALIALFAITATSCSDSSLLDQEPYDSISEEKAFANPENIELSVNGMYEAAAIGNYSGSGRGYVWGAAWVEQNDAKGEDVVNTEVFYQQTYLSNQNPSGANSRYYWEDGYGLINKANLVIEGVTEAKEDDIITEEKANDIIGQARFLRGITHFELLIQFARPYSDDPDGLGVPYRDTPVNTDEAREEALQDGGRDTIEEVYSQALDDLDFAEENITTNELTRASSNAAIAFKTRIYLNMREWEKVIDEANKLKNAYIIEEEPYTVFADNEGNSESIFSIAMDSKSNAGVNGALASQYNDRELLAISPIIWNKEGWLEDDKRRAMIDSDEGEEQTEEAMIKKSGGTLFSLKYRDTETLTDDSPVMRYAEVKLNLAEALARTGDMDGAIENLNDVRDRSLANPETQSYTSADFSSPEELVQSIILERRIEFLAEGHRWGDIHLLQGDDMAPIDGIPAKHTNGYPDEDEYDAASGSKDYSLNVSSIPYDDYRFVWPIPNSEVSVNDNIEQNPGY